MQAAARTGFLAKALLYAVIATLALLKMAGEHGALADIKGALERTARTPLGTLGTAAVGLGIASLGLWFILEAVVNPGRQRGPWAAVTRLGQAAGGLGYLGLGAVALRLLAGEPAGPSGDELARQGVAGALRLPGGPVAAALAGAITVGVGLRQAYMGLSRRFLRAIDLSALAPALRHLAARVGAVGFAAQGALFAGAGASVLRAAVNRAPRQASGTHGVLVALFREPHGRALVVLAALGLLAYALYALVEGRFRRLPAPRPWSGRTFTA
jgi:hypothetical protein